MTAPGAAPAGRAALLAAVVVATVAVLVAVVALLALRPPDAIDGRARAAAPAAAHDTTDTPPEPLPPTVGCVYPSDGEAPARPVAAPAGTGVSTDGRVVVTLVTSAGTLDLTLDRALAPCAVESFLSLGAQGYFDDTPCHRLTTTGIRVLQCGDPTGTGTGTPGYSFADEYPVEDDLDPATEQPIDYERGFLAMANAGPDTNGSQFFLVYDASPLPPAYTIFGLVGHDGLATLDAVAERGTADGSGDGIPAELVTITGLTG